MPGMATSELNFLINKRISYFVPPKNFYIKNELYFINIKGDPTQGYSSLMS